LIHRRQLDSLRRETAEKGLSLVPLRVYFSHGIAKVEIALARGKRQHEKRQTIAKRDAQREAERELGRRR
jgi:SsrA-binding protein